MSALSIIQRQLGERFEAPGEAGRIVIWNDPDGDYDNGCIEDLDLPGVTVLRVDGNEFAIKRRVLAAEPTRKFLIHRPSPGPDDPVANWLLDLELAYGTFTADPASLVVQELGGGPALREVAEQYPTFFREESRVAALKARLEDGDDATDIAAKMVAAVIGCQGNSLDVIWRNLLTENASGESTWIDEITGLGLAGFHWAGTRDIYGYGAETPSVDDFVRWLFARAWEKFASPEPGEYRNIGRDFSMWSNDVRFADTHRALARRAADELAIEDRVAELDLPALAERFTFEEVDQRIIALLATGVEQRTMTDQDVRRTVGRRATGIWYQQYEQDYQAIAAASTLSTRIEALPPSIGSPAEGFRRYVEEWFAIDQSYRQFIVHAGRAVLDEPLGSLRQRVEALYTGSYLGPLGNAWQEQVDAMDRWTVDEAPSASSFYNKRVRPVLHRGNKIVVIVSDALRYDVAEELARRIREEDRFSAELTAMLGALPSYTQLGMAALLPHKTLALAEGSKGLVEVDGGPSDGTKNRARILQAVGGTAVQASDFTRLRPGEARELVKAHRVLYLYHNQIDATGDDPTTESRVFQACEDTIEELIRLVKKLANANVNNVLITADHGFLHQDTPLDESQYLTEKPHADALLYANHRFVLGRGLKRSPAFTTFTPAQLGLAGRVEAQVPKSIHRLRMAGSGVRYVHGGAALQEIVVPVLAINKRRTSDTRQVAVRIMAQTDRITTGQITVVLHQEEPVSEKVKGRTLIAGLYADDVLISNEVRVSCSQTSPEERDRLFPVTLMLSKEADDANGRTVELRLSEQVGASERRPYPDKARFTLVRTFTSDFDF